MRAAEPALFAAGGAVSPSTGIVDSHALMLAYQGEAEAEGAAIAFNTPFLGAHVEDDGAFRVHAGGADPVDLRATALVNAAGLSASRVAAAISGLDPARVPETLYARGTYFLLQGRAPFRRLIYPMPNEAGLGVHLTLDMGGQARFGPDVEWVSSLDYRVEAGRADSFYAAVRRYWPGLADGALYPGYSGIRPKLVGPGAPPADFRIDGPAEHSIPGLVNLFGIESPGLTASLALAAEVRRRLELDGKSGHVQGEPGSAPGAPTETERKIHV